MGEFVYLLCGATSTACAVLLGLRYRSTHNRLKLWTCWGFSGLALNNILLFVDMVVMPQSVDLSTIRALPAVVGLSVMVWGMVNDTLS